MQTLRSMGMPAHLHHVPGSTKHGQCRHMTDLELPRTPGTAYSLSCAWEKLWQETGSRSDECSWQAEFSLRTVGWAPSCSPSFANAVLPTTLSTVSWTACVTYCLFPLAMCSFIPSSCIHRSSVSPWTALLTFLFYFSPSTPFSVTFHYTKLAPSALPDSLLKLCVSLYHELLPFSCFMTHSTCGW